MKQAIIIQARTGSTRLPQKMIKPFFEGKSLIELILEKLVGLQKCSVVLATSDLKRDDILADFAKKAGAEVYRGDEDDVLKRFIKAAESIGAEQIIRVCADNPFLSKEYIVDLLKKMADSNSEYVSYAFPDGTPTIKSHIGLFAEGMTLEALKKVANLTKEKLYREHVTNYIYAHRDIFNVQLFPLPEHLKNKTKLRFTLDTEVDFTLLSKLYKKAHLENFDLKQLIEFVESERSILDVMRAEVEKNSK